MDMNLFYTHTLKGSFKIKFDIFTRRNVMQYGGTIHTSFQGVFVQ